MVTKITSELLDRKSHRRIVLGARKRPPVISVITGGLLIQFIFHSTGNTTRPGGLVAN